jgi:hypothetical protein
MPYTAFTVSALIGYSVTRTAVPELSLVRLGFVDLSRTSCIGGQSKSNVLRRVLPVYSQVHAHGFKSDSLKIIVERPAAVYSKCGRLASG